MHIESPLEGLEQGSIAFCFEDIRVELPPEATLKAWLQAIAEAEGTPVLELTYIFTSDEYLRRINAQYLKHDYYTDVITFPYTPGAAHGDVFISLERVRENARQYDVSFEHELCRVMAHGLLHLAGYTDATDAERARMRQKEDEYLRQNPLLSHSD
ncbi:MAG: rRNA maturation RNase YbeY [Saprospiraceae bacterium]|nr:rRNA maturation RNase YbeY [Saprospiraceae bacterium]MDW8229694.1 rRNA maturation RNase YbeY [Saprospiraceae bacterium]